MERTRKTLQQLTISSAFMFGAVMVEPKFLMGDGTHTIFLSTKGKNEDEVPKELVNFLKYVEAPLSESEKDFEDEFVARLQKTVKEVKVSREMGARYMTFQELLKDEREAGRAEGQEAKLKELVEKKLRKGLSVREIADMLEEDESTIAEIEKIIRI